jgi:hypothetical protein
VDSVLVEVSDPTLLCLHLPNRTVDVIYNGETLVLLVQVSPKLLDALKWNIDQIQVQVDLIPIPNVTGALPVSSQRSKSNPGISFPESIIRRIEDHDSGAFQFVMRVPVKCRDEYLGQKIGVQVSIGQKDVLIFRLEKDTEDVTSELRSFTARNVFQPLVSERRVCIKVVQLLSPLKIQCSSRLEENNSISSFLIKNADPLLIPVVIEDITLHLANSVQISKKALSEGIDLSQRFQQFFPGVSFAQASSQLSR